MKPQERADYEIWWVLQEIKKECLILRSDHFVVRKGMPFEITNAHADTAPTHETQTKILYRLHELGTVIIDVLPIGVETEIVFIDGIPSLAKKEKQSYNPELSIRVIQPKFEQIYSKYEGLASTTVDNKSLKGRKITYDETKQIIFIDAIPCTLMPSRNESDLAKVMFKKEIGQFVDWSILYEEITGIEALGIDKQNQKRQKMLRDTKDRLNKHIKHVVNTEDNLLSWKNKSISRNY